MAKRFKNVYQFKVALERIRPTIWRTIQIPQSYSFWDLHVAIQDAMGWWDCHLHAFRVKDPASDQTTLIGIPDDDAFDDGPEFLPGWEIAIADYFAQPGDFADYEYDFGDGWEHRLVLEEIAPRKTRVKYPRCLAGERACPPEDCGGPPGYETLLQILADPEHEEHEETLTWVGSSYDANTFDPKAVRFADPKKRWKTAFEEPEPEAESVLETILDDPSRAVGSMTYREAHGFLFAVASTPEMIVPSEWVPQIFGGNAPDFESDQQAGHVLGELIDIYDGLRADAGGGQARLPHDCWFYEDILDNYANHAPMKQWSRGFIRGHTWLEEIWETSVPDAEKEEHLVVVMTLAFFSSRRVGEGLIRESVDTKLSLPELAEMMRDVYADAMDQYSLLGQSLYRARLARQTKPAVRGRRTERNAPCPCGSGKKFKKCCLGGGPDITH